MQTCQPTSGISHQPSVLTPPNDVLKSSQPIVANKFTEKYGIADWQLSSFLSKKKQTVKLLRVVNRILMTLAAGLVGYLLIDGFVMNRRPVNDFTHEDFKAEPPHAIRTTLVARPFGFYLANIEKRNIFKPFHELQGGGVQEIAATLKQKVQILGILLDREPVVVIKNLKTRDITFASIGQGVEGAVVAEVLDGEVIFSYKGKKIKMKP